MKIQVEIKAYYGIKSILSQLPTFDDVEAHEEVEIEILYTCGTFIKGEIFALLVSYIRFLEKNGKTVTVIYDPDEECETIKYAARINFFQLVGIDFNEKFNRRSASGRFLEITEFNEDNLWDIVHETVKMFKVSLGLKESILDSVYHCFGEVVDNIDTHAESNNGGIIYAQHFTASRNIKIFIIDSGIGFHESLKRCEEYKEISHEECLSKCCEKGITDGKGKGMGLYHTSLFVSANNGSLSINSCGKELVKTKTDQIVLDSTYWQGSIVSLQLKKDQAVNYKEVFEGYEPNTFADLEESRNEKIDELW